MRNFSGKTRVTPRPRHKVHPALPRLPPKPFRRFARLAEPNDDANINFLATKFNSLAVDGASHSMPMDTGQIPTTSIPSGDHSGSTQPMAPPTEGSAAFEDVKMQGEKRTRGNIFLDKEAVHLLWHCHFL